MYIPIKTFNYLIYKKIIIRDTSDETIYTYDFGSFDAANSMYNNDEVFVLSECDNMRKMFVYYMNYMEEI